MFQVFLYYVSFLSGAASEASAYPAHGCLRRCRSCDICAHLQVTKTNKLFPIAPCRRHVVLAVIILTLAAMLCPAYSLPSATLGTASGVKNLRMPIGDDPSLPVATFTIGEIKFEKRQMGPFFLGVLQRPVFENVDVELKPKRSEEEWGRALRSFFEQATRNKSVLFRNFTLRTSNGPNLLRSREGEFDPVNDLISLTDVTFACGSGKDRSVPEAKLLLSDKEFCILMLRGDVEDERIKLVPQAP